MKNQFYLIVFLTAISLFTQAQDEYEYTPFPDSNAIWSEYYEPPLGSDEDPSYHALALFNEDTVINSITYHKLFRLYDTVLNREKAEYIGGIREDSSKRVYYNGTNLYEEYLHMNTNENGEVLLYDFSLEVGDTLYERFFGGGNEFSVVSEIDTVYMAQKLRKFIYFEDYYWVEWIEGIGNIRGLLFISASLPTNGIYNTLVCFKRDGRQEYFNDQFNGCFPGPLASSIEDVKGKSVRVFPNPAKERICFKNAEDYEHLSIYNLNGKKLKQKPVFNRKRISISLSAYSPGMYFYKLIGPSGQIKTGKFIVK